MGGVTTENRNVKVRAEEKLGGTGKMHFPTGVGSSGHTVMALAFGILPPWGGFVPPELPRANHQTSVSSVFLVG